MNTIQDNITGFLNQKKIAVAGVSRNGDTAGNLIYKKLRSSGYQVYAINPNASEVEGDIAFENIAAIPDGIDALVIATHPDQAPGLVQQCRAAGVRHLWFHRSMGQGSYNEEAVRTAEALGMSVIPGGCPMMFCEPVDIFHKCLKWVTRFPEKS